MKFRLSPMFLLGLIIFALLSLSIGLSASYATASTPRVEKPYAPDAVPDGYIHRPVVEFFTGLSCSSCMSGPESDMEKLDSEGKADESSPYEVIFFHELNGGGKDDLRTDESEERMRHYQPGVSGTPDAEFDGGYVELGGMTSPGGDVSYDNAKGAVDTCTTRYETTFNPLKPISSLRSSFKFVTIQVQQYYQGDQFGVTVKVEYLGMNSLNPLLKHTPLNGELDVFMVEDDVPAFSTETNKIEINPSVFRGYAIKAQDFTLNMNENSTFSGAWTIPKDATVPVNPGKVRAVAVVYDLDDTSSQDGNKGNKAQGVPRAIQCATPKSTAYDMGNDGPVIKDITAVRSGGKINVSAQISDPDGLSQAYLLYTTDSNGTNWKSVKMNLQGAEQCDEDTGICYAVSSGGASAEFDAPKGDIRSYYIIANDAKGAFSVSQVMNGTGISQGNSKGEGNESVGVSSTVIIIMTLLIIGILGLTYMAKRKKMNITGNRTTMAVVITVIIIGAVLAGLVASGGSFLPGMKSTSKAPDFVAKTSDGGEFQLSDHRGKVVLIDFFSTTCEGCEEAIQNLVKVYPDYKDNVVFISLTTDSKDTNSILRDYAQSHGVKWTMAHADSKTIKDYGIVQIPKIVIVDASGNIVYEHVGPEAPSVLSKNLDQAISGTASPVSITTTSGTLGIIIMGIIAGAAMFFSPCSFPLLPGYISYYLATQKKKMSAVEGLKAGLISSAGIVLVFLIIGVLVALLGNAISRWLYILLPIIGITLVIMGIVLLIGLTVPIWYVTEPVKAFFGKFRGNKAGAATGAPSTSSGGLFAYGMGYAAAASSCTAPILVSLIFIAMAAGGFMGGILIFSVFAVSMSLLMIVFTIMTAVSGQAIAQKYSKAMIYIEKGSAVILIIVGVYFVWDYLSLYFL